jgi:hypothetical protein
MEPVGTIDIAKSTIASGGLLLSVDAKTAAKEWTAAIQTQVMTIKNTEADLRKLTLGFMLSASSAQPVTVSIDSINAHGKVSGTLRGNIDPAAPDFYQRYSLDLSTFSPVGKGKFNPLDVGIRMRFEIARNKDALGWENGVHALHVDNISYASPAYYVSTKGSGANIGRSEQTAFATPQKALDVATAGDTF